MSIEVCKTEEEYREFLALIRKDLPELTDEKVEEVVRIWKEKRERPAPERL